VLAAAVLLAACSSSPAAVAPEPSTPSTTSTPAATSTTSTSTTTSVVTTTTVPGWVLGATPLPLRPDGFGEVLATPEALVRRELPTIDLLPPPPDEVFRSSIAAIDPATRNRMGETWQEGCPVPVEDLRRVTVSHWGFDGAAHTGELVLHRDVAEDVVGVFARLHELRFPIEQLRITTTADLDAHPTGDGNGSGSFTCRVVRGGSSLSQHSFGTAVDINPFQNPFQRGDLVLPELASAYLDRTDVRPGMILPGDEVVAAFAAIGWHWGGDWTEPDHMHFSRDGG
jgi:D-alanyl-D-alanine carboxypeptidase